MTSDGIFGARALLDCPLVAPEIEELNVNEEEPKAVERGVAPTEADTLAPVAAVVVEEDDAKNPPAVKDGDGLVPAAACEVDC